MAINDPLGDLLTRIRNGQKAGMQKIATPASKLRANVLDVLKREGYIRDFSVDASKPGGEITVELTSHAGSPVIQEINRVFNTFQRPAACEGQQRQATATPDWVPVVDVLEDGAFNQRRLVARTPGATTLKVSALTLSAELELEVLP